MFPSLHPSQGEVKTTLAVHWAHDVRQNFPDGQLYLNLRGFDPAMPAITMPEAVRRFLDALNVPSERIPTDLDSQIALYRSLLAGKRLLILLDNARDAHQVRPLLPGTPGCLVIVTSRNQLTSLIATDDAHPITLDVLTDNEAHQLLAARLGGERVTADPHAADAIVVACARLPLALAIVAARATTRPHTPLATLARELRDARNPLDALAENDPHADVRAVLSWSYQALTPDAARLFRLLGLHPGPDLSVPAAASLAALPAGRTRQPLGELVDANLVVEYAPGRFTFHDLLRAYAADLTEATDTERERQAATHRILDHYLHIAYTAERLLNPKRDPITLSPPFDGTILEPLSDQHAAMTWFQAEHQALRASIHHSIGTGFPTHAWQLAWTMFSFLDRRGQWDELIVAAQAAIDAADKLGDSTVQARAYRNLAHACTRLGRFQEATTHLRHALDLHHRAGDQIGEAHTHVTLADVLGRQDSIAEALEHSREAQNLFRAAGHQWGEAQALNGVGWYNTQLGNHHDALTACERALALLQQLGHGLAEACTWDSLGLAHHNLGNHQQAITCYTQALTLSRNFDDHYLQAAILTRLGDTHHAAGDRDRARETWHQALTILTDLNHPDAEQLHNKLTD